MAGRVPEFDASVEDFSAYSRRLQQYFISNDVSDASKKRAVFLCAIGAKTFGLVEDLIAPCSVEQKTYDQLVTVLKEHFEPDTSAIVARFRFHTCVRGEAESVSVFLARLRKLAKPCRFPAELLDELLRDRLVCGISHEQLQSRLLSEPGLTLKSAVDLAMAQESAAASAAELSSSLKTEVAGGAAVHRVAEPAARRGQRPPGGDGASGGGGGGGGRGRDRVAGSCSRCLRRHQPESCPFRNKQCFRCGRTGHIRAVCDRWTRQQHLHQVEESDVPRGAGAAMADDYRAAEDQRDGAGAPDREDSEVYALFNLRPGLRRRPPLLVDPALDGRPVKMEVDTGAAVSVCSSAGFRRLWPDSGPELEPCSVQLKTYSEEALKVLGQVLVNVHYAGQAARLPLVVVDGAGPCLLGRNWLEHIRLDWPSICRVSSQSRVEGILEEFPEVFEDGLGCYNGGEVNIEVDPDVQPRFYKPRTVPLAFREEVDSQLEKGIKDGIWEPVKHSKWAAPLVVVPKDGGKSVRICGDYRLTINKAAKVEQYPLPRIEELCSKLTGCTIYSKVDLKSAYNQLVLDERSREYLTINTPRGLLRPCRLGFGYASAVSLFQRTLESVLAGIPGVGLFLDDIVCAGRDQGEHDASLREVLRRLQETGLRVNKAKCRFSVSEITYLGFRISGNGVETTTDKVDAILKAPNPQNVKELRMWLGLINYYSRFLQNLATCLAPLYRLLRADQPWRWSEVESLAFQRAKALLVSPPVLAHFDPALPVIVACDAGPRAVGCVLSQQTREGERPVAFYSRMLSDTETRYSQTDREALAVITGVKKWHYYLAGRAFRIQTDHKPLLGIIGEQKALPVMASPRMVRWALMLGAYDYRLEYRPGSKQVHCDALSRLPAAAPAPESVPRPAETLHLMEFLDSSPVSVSQIRRWTSVDPVLSQVYRFVRDGWPSSGEVLGPDFQPYKSRLGELSVEDGCILWGARVVVPPQGRRDVLRLLHEGHPGETRTKMLARMYLWWPRLDDDIRELVTACGKCQEFKNRAPAVPLHPWVWPTRPWERVHMDYCALNGNMFLVLVCAHSKWMDVYPTRSSDTDTTIERLRVSFAAWGVPPVLVSDNAQAFVSKEFAAFCKVNGIRHLTTPCLSPKSNGAAEKAVDILKRGLQKQSAGSVQTKVSRFLFRYRTTPQSTTQCTPAELFLGRLPRTHLDTLIPSLENKVRARQEVQKAYKDRGCQDRDVSVGDRVYVSAVDNLQGLGKCRWVPGHVMCRAGLKITVELIDGRVIVRHADQVRRRYHDVPTASLPMPNERSLPQRTESPAPPEAPVTQAPPDAETARLPDRSPSAELPAADLTSRPTPVCSADSAAAGQGPCHAAVPPRYSLRDRTAISRPDRLTYK